MAASHCLAFSMSASAGPGQASSSHIIIIKV